MKESVKQIITSGKVDSIAVARGWVRTRRGNKKIAFIELNDGSTIKSLQVVADIEMFGEEIMKRVNTGSCLEVEGKLVQSPGKEQAVELQATKISILGEANPETYPLQKKGHSLEFLREIAHLRPRTNTFGAILRIRHSAAFAIHDFFNRNGFFYIHTPIITGADAEGAGAMFRVTTLDPGTVPEKNGTPDYAEDFFGKQTNLTVSGQLEGETAALALSKIYTFGPTFRAENSNTARHLAEFWMIEPEAAFYDIKDNIQLAEDFLKFIIAHVLRENADDLAFLDKMYENGLMEKLRFVSSSEFKKITYTEAIDILNASSKKFEFMVEWGKDLQSEHERFLVEEHFKLPVIVTDYPKVIKAFYMKLNDDEKTVRAMDVLFPGIGEIIGGSQREDNHDKLLQRMREMHVDDKELWWYLELRKFGSAPHSGFGLGFERLILFLTGMSNIRDVIPFPRTPKNAEF